MGEMPIRPDRDPEYQCDKCGTIEGTYMWEHIPGSYVCVPPWTYAYDRPYGKTLYFCTKCAPTLVPLYQEELRKWAKRENERKAADLRRKVAEAEERIAKRIAWIKFFKLGWLFGV